MTINMFEMFLITIIIPLVHTDRGEKKSLIGTTDSNVRNWGQKPLYGAKNAFCSSAEANIRV